MDKVTTATKEDLLTGGIFFVEFNGKEPLKGTMLIKFEMKFFEEQHYITREIMYARLIINRE